MKNINQFKNVEKICGEAWAEFENWTLQDCSNISQLLSIKSESSGQISIFSNEYEITCIIINKRSSIR